MLNLENTYSVKDNTNKRKISYKVFTIPIFKQYYFKEKSLKYKPVHPV